jgi:fluoroacetyl-CoA thioesterase
MEAGQRAEITVVVGVADTAAALGSGDVPVLGTPRLLALAEAATVRAVAGALAPGQTSVGTSIRLEHTAASPVGTRVTVTAELTVVDGRRLTFRVEAVDGRGTVLGLGTVERVLVDREKFLARLL